VTDHNNNLANVGSGNVRRLSRAFSANAAARHVDSSPLATRAGHDVAYLYQQLQDALQQQTRIEGERQRQLGQYRRQLRALCDDNAMLRSIIQAGETRRRDAAKAVADSSGGGLSSAAGSLRAHSSGTHTGPASVTEAELEVVEQRIHLARQRHNRLVHDIHVNRVALEQEEQARAMIAEEAKAPLDPASLLMGANRPVYLRMMRLEHLLNEVLQKQSMIGIVLKNYRYHLKTLREEATQYEMHQRMLENEYADRHRDHLQLLELHDTARGAYADAVDALAALQQSAEKMRLAKEKALQQKRKEVERELAATQLQERRAVDLQQQLEEETQLLEAAENTKAQLEKQRLNSRTALTLLKATSTSRDGGGANPAATSNATAAGPDGQMPSSTTDERIAAFEAAFRDMMKVAKADTLDHLVEIYQAEMEQQCKLQDDLDDLRKARATLQHETQALRERLKQTKSCVGAGTRFGGTEVAATADAKGAAVAASPLLEREMETFLREEGEALAAQITENEQNQSLLMEVAERMNRLSALVAEYRADVRLPAIRLSPALSKRSSTLPLHSAVLAQKLLALASDAAPRDALTNAAAAATGSTSTLPHVSDNTGALAVVSSTQIVIPANNRRVPLAHERSGRLGGHGGVGGGGAARGIDGGGGGGRPRYSADVVGISSSAARALLNASEKPAASLGASPDGVGGDFMMRRRRRSSASAGAGFIEGQDDDDDDTQLARVAALPPPGGRVLDFDLESSVDSDGQSISGSTSDRADRVNEGGIDCDGHPTTTAAAAFTGPEGEEGDASAVPRRRRRSSVKAVLASRSGGNTRGANAINTTGAGAAGGAEEDQEDPLRRDEVKKMSEMMQERRRRDAEEAAGEASHK
jgi:hypothetical protein